MGGVIYSYRYDMTGQITLQTNTAGQQQEFYYDEAEHLTRIVDTGAGRITDYGYDAAGRRARTTTTDAGIIHEDTRTEYDAAGRVDLIAGLGYSVAYSYDAAGNRTHILGTYTDAPGSGKAQDLWYQYDQMNRVTISQGVNAGGAVTIDVDASGSNNPTQGTILMYDARGIRTSAASYGDSLYIIQDLKGNPTVAYVKGTATETYEYDGLGRLKNKLLSTTTLNLIGSADYTPTVVDARTYDRASRVLSQATAKIESGVYAQRNSTSDYNDDGQVILQTTTKNGINESRVVYGDVNGDATFTPDSIGYQFDGDPWSGGGLYEYYIPASWSTGYDAAGNLRGYIVNVYDGSGTHVYDSTHLFSYDRLADTYLQTQHQVLNTSGGPLNGSTTNTYDVNNELIQITDDQAHGNNRYFANNAAGQALTVVKGDYGSNPSGAFSNAVVGAGLFNTSNAGYFFYSADGQSVGSFSPLNGALTANFDVNYEPISDQYPASTPQQYVVQQGDTLRIIAARVYGDAKLWYVIAQANGLSDPDALQTPGTALSIPNDVVSLSNTSNSFKPFNVMSAIGDTTPTQPLPPPPQSHGGGCGIIGMIIAIIVCIIIDYFSFGTASESNAPILTWAGVLEAAAIGAGEAIVVDAVTQGINIALGYQDSFNWKELAAAGITGFITGGLGNVGGGISGSPIISGAINGAMRSAVGQGVNIAMGLQKSFSWRNLAISAAASGASSQVGNWTKGWVPKGQTSTIARDLTLEATSIGVRMALGGKVDGVQVAADIFGNAVGNSIVGAMNRPSAAEREDRNNRQQGEDFLAAYNAKNPNLAEELFPTPDFTSLDNNPDSFYGVQGSPDAARNGYPIRQADGGLLFESGVTTHPYIPVEEFAAVDLPPGPNDAVGYNRSGSWVSDSVPSGSSAPVQVVESLAGAGSILFSPFGMLLDEGSSLSNRFIGTNFRTDRADAMFQFADDRFNNNPYAGVGTGTLNALRGAGEIPAIAVDALTRGGSVLFDHDFGTNLSQTAQHFDEGQISASGLWWEAGKNTVLSNPYIGLPYAAATSSYGATTALLNNNLEGFVENGLTLGFAFGGAKVGGFENVNLQSPIVFGEGVQNVGAYGQRGSVISFDLQSPLKMVGGDALFINKAGEVYPDVPDLRTGRSIPFPTDELARVDTSARVDWGASHRGGFIREWYDRGYETPRGGWENYDIHHIRPREFGGTNDFWNLSPVPKLTHYDFNTFWKNY